MLLQQLERFLSVAGGGYPIALFVQDHSDEMTMSALADQLRSCDGSQKTEN